MAEDTAIINSVSTESLGPVFDAFFALAVGLGIGFVYEWKISLICLAAAPIMAIGGVMEMHAAAGFQDEEGKKALAEANLLCGDAIVNYKTVQSFGHEDLIVKKYVEMLSPIKANSNCAHLGVAFGFGFSQLMQFAIFAGLFYFGAIFMERDYPEVKSENVFIAMFSIMFGAQQMGTAFAMGPDAGKGELASQRVFRIVESESTINAIEMDSKKSGKMINIADIKGKIEFRNVWFRYPTRPEEFVLRGLNIEIEAGESVALVGESGCGKSTFINLLMRFYDPEFGEVLLDDVNIKEYNLHSLRTAISLVMQEPIVFNYSILENILYGKLEASNTEVAEAAEKANCMEFITKGDVEQKLEDTASALIGYMNKYKDQIVTDIGQAKFDEEMEVLEKQKEIEGKKGAFVT